MEEKGGLIFSNKVQDKIDTYLNENYSSVKNIKKNNIEYNNKIFKVKVESKINSNHFFYITYTKRKITDTYNNDYIEGKNLLAHIEKELENKITNKTKLECTVHSTNTLNNYSEKIQEKLIKEENLLELKFYYIEKELIIKKWNSKDITNEIIKFIEIINKNNIKPKYYKIIITQEDDITNSIEINNLTEEFLNNKNNIIIIDNILNNRDINDNKITFKYLN